MKIYCNYMNCQYIKKLDAPVNYAPCKGYKSIYEYKFNGECDVPHADEGCMCSWPCQSCSFSSENGCLKENIFIDEAYKQDYSCRCYSNKFRSGHMDWSRFVNQKKTFL